MRVFILVLVVVLSFSVVSCANKENNNSGASTTDPVSTANTTEPTSETAANTAKETPETSRLDGIEQKYLNKLLGGIHSSNDYNNPYSSTFAEVLDSSANSDSFEVTIDFTFNAAKEAESYALEKAGEVSEQYVEFKKDYVKGVYVTKTDEFLKRHNIEKTKDVQVGLYSPYISKLTLTSDQIVEVIKDEDVMFVTWNYYNESTDS